MANTQNSIQHGLNAAKANASNSQEEQQVNELAQQLGNNQEQQLSSNQTQQQADGIRYDYDDASDV